MNRRIPSATLGTAAVAATTVGAAPNSQALTTHTVCAYNVTAAANIRSGPSVSYNAYYTASKGHRWISNPAASSGGYIKVYDQQTGRSGWVISSAVGGGQCHKEPN